MKAIPSDSGSQVTRRPHERAANGGFSLVELLVVVTILVLLVSISFPALRFAKERGQRLRCASGLKTLALAAILYAGDHNDTLLVKTLGMDPYQLRLGRQQEIDQGHPDLRNMFQSYLPEFDKALGPSPLMFCPSSLAHSDQERRALSLVRAAQRWQAGDYVLGYAYWAAREANLDAIGVEWVSEVDPVYRLSDRAYTPIFSDPLEKHHFMAAPTPWGVASHTRAGTIGDTSTKPIGQNNARLDGSVVFRTFAENHHWADRSDLNQFGDLEAATHLREDNRVLLLWSGIQ